MRRGRRIRRGGVRAEPPLLGHRRQRRQPDRGREIRIKLSELCYKSIACDATEDKKHIDLSSEPLILVCAAGLIGSTADDVAKEVAIYRAHKAAPIVIASEGDRTVRRGAAGPDGARDAPASRVRARHHGRSPVRLRGRAGHRRAGPAAAGGPGRDRPPRPTSAVTCRAPTSTVSCSSSPPSGAGPPGRHVPRRAALRRLQRPPRGEHRGPSRRPLPLRHRRAARSTPTSSSTARSARRVSCSRTSPRASPRPSRS